MPARRALSCILPPRIAAKAFAILLLAALVFGIAPGQLRAEGEEPVDPETAELDLGRLAASLKSRKSINEAIITDLDAVALAYHNYAAPEKPTLEEVPEDASEDQKAAIQKRNDDLTDEYDTKMVKYEREKEKYQKDALKLYMKAFKLVRVHGNTDRNTRDDVNIKAAQIIGASGNPRASRDLIKALESSVFKAKYDVPQLFLEEAFAALGRLNDMDSLQWMIKEFTHAKSSPPEVVHQLIAAHKAMVLFVNVPGKLRYEVVEDMIKQYAGVEAQARQSKNDPATQAKKRFWDSIKNDAIKVVQHYAGAPRNDDDEAYATMMEFQDWFRDHKNPKRAPWVEEAIKDD